MSATHLIALDSRGQVFRVAPEQTLQHVCSSDLTPGEKIVAGCTAVEYFRHPFNALLAVSRGSVVDEWKIHPNVFYPLTPLDYENGIASYAAAGFAYPVRLSTHLTDNCNCECTICTYIDERRKMVPTAISGQKYLEALEHLSGKTSILGHDISGGGDPSLHPLLPMILDFSRERGIRTFLTTNGTIHPKSQEKLLQSIAASVSVLTVSIKGLTPDTYKALQQPKSGKVTFDQVMANIESIVQERARLGREREFLVGVASVVHPENCGHYTEFVERLVDVGVDYIYLNPIEPNLDTYGLKFTPAQVESTVAEIESLRVRFADCRTYIRFPRILFRQTGSVYIEARRRINSDVCMMPVLQPLLIPNSAKKGKGKLVCCRYHKIRNNPEFQFTDAFGEQPFLEMWTQDKLDRVTKSTQQCTVCPCERQSMALDWMLHIKKTKPASRFYLQFDLRATGAGVHHFERAIESRYDRSSITQGFDLSP